MKTKIIKLYFAERNIGIKKVIEDGFSKGYDRLESAFEAIGVEVSGGGEAMYEGMSIKDIKKGLKKEGIKLLVNDKTFLEELNQNRDDQEERDE